MPPKSKPAVDIELDAIRLEVEWTSLFTEALYAAAQELAAASGVVTSEHLRRALPTAISQMMQAITSDSEISTDAWRQTA